MQKIPYNTDQNNPVIRTYKEAIERGKENQHVLPYKGKWAVSNLVSGKIRQIFTDQNEAIKFAESNAAAGTAVFIHGFDRRIKERKDY